MRTVSSKEKFLIFPSNLQNSVPNNSHTRVQSVLQPATHYTVLNVKPVHCILAHLYLNINQLFRKIDWHTSTVINLLLTLWHISLWPTVFLMRLFFFFACLLILLLIYPAGMQKKKKKKPTLFGLFVCYEKLQTFSFCVNTHDNFWPNSACLEQRPSTAGYNIYLQDTSTGQYCLTQN